MTLDELMASLPQDRRDEIDALATKPRVTPLMIEAGYQAYLLSTDTTRATLAEVYRAMHLYRPLSEGPEA